MWYGSTFVHRFHLWETSYFEVILDLYPRAFSVRSHVYLCWPNYYPDFSHIDWVMEAWNLTPGDDYSDYLTKREIPF